MLLKRIFFLTAVGLYGCNENNDAPPTAPPKVTKLNSAHPLVVGERAFFVATGTNLSSSNVSVSANLCENITIENTTSEQLSFSCVPNTYGKQLISIQDSQNKSLFSQSFLVGSLATNLLNDTGIRVCEADNNTLVAACESSKLGSWFGLEQDGLTGRDMLAATAQLTKTGAGAEGFDFSKISATGELLADNAKSWNCVLDNRTGLLWEVKTADGGLRDAQNTYTWYSPDSTKNGGDAGLENNGKNTDAFVKSVNQVGLCGYKDWDLPTAEQLLSIVHYGRDTPTIDVAYFPNTVSDLYWTSTTHADKFLAQTLSFDYGVLENAYKKHSFIDVNHFVRLVRFSQ